MKIIIIDLNIIFHILVIVIWSFSYQLNIYSHNEALINFLSIAIAYLFINELYIKLVSRKDRPKKQSKTKHLWPILWISTLVIKELPLSVIIVLFLLSELLGIIELKDRHRDRKFYSYALFLVLGLAFHLQDLKFLAALVLALAIIFDTNLTYGYKELKNLNLLPIARESIGKFVGLILIVFTLIFSILSLETLVFQIFIQILMMLIILLLTINLENQESYYEEVKSFYLLTHYLDKERDDFSRLIHDEFIQDVKASRTLLNVNKPDIDKTKQILKDLENKSRKIMNFYSSNLFDYFSFDENFENMIQSVETLYPQKDIDLNWSIDRISKKGAQRLIMQVSKELLNNIFKHSNATYINFTCQDLGDQYLLLCESDGANKQDYEKIEKSIGGVLILKLLVSKNHGEMEYEYNGGILKTRISLGGSKD